MAPTVLRQLDALLLRVDGSALVAVDGRNGVGKSTLARTLVARMGGTRIGVDDFVVRQQDRDTRELVYADLLDHDSLRAAIEGARQRGAVWLDGLCMLEVVRRLGLRLDVHVLVSPMDPACARFSLERAPLFDARLGNIADAALLDDAVTARDLELAMARERPGVNDVVQKSNVRYFKTEKPHRTAHVIYVRR
jgi:hypothetical protein